MNDEKILLELFNDFSIKLGIAGLVFAVLLLGVIYFMLHLYIKHAKKKKPEITITQKKTILKVQA